MLLGEFLLRTVEVFVIRSMEHGYSSFDVWCDQVSSPKQALYNWAGADKTGASVSHE